jgi:hypothetical protein
MFLATHDGELAARVKREVRNKLATGLKNPRGRIEEVCATSLAPGATAGGGEA